MDSYSYFYLANWGLVVGCAIGAIAVLSYLCQSRRLFLVLSAGAVIGSLLPGVLGGMGRSTGGFLDNLSLYREGVIQSTIVGTVLAWMVVGIANMWWKRRNSEPLQ